MASFLKSAFNAIKEKGIGNVVRELKEGGFLRCLPDGNLLQTKIHNIGATLVGVDKFGNKYYEKLQNTQYGRHRWVEYGDKSRYNASQVPPEWHGWLHHITDHTGDELLMLKPQRYGIEHKQNFSGEGDEFSLMAGFRSLKTLLRNPKSRSFLSLCASSTPFPSPSPPLSSIFSSFPQSSIFATSSTSFLYPFRLTSTHSRFLSPPFSRWIPFSGPLFLSSPPWQLSQSATPLYLHREFVLQKAESLKLNLNLLKRNSFPIKLGYGSINSVPVSLNVIDQKELRSNVETNGGFAESFVNLPNMISMSRLVSGPFLGWMIMNEWYFSAFVGLAISGVTDWLDGYVARKMGINSVVGSYLDPLADKVLIGCVALAMVKMDLLQSWLVGLVVLRDVGLVSGAVYKRASSLNWQWKSWSEFTNLNGTHRQKVEPLFLSKVNTVFQLVLVAAALLQPEFGTLETEVYITYLSWLVASTTAASTVAYGVQHLRNRSTLVAGGSFPRSKSC